MFHGPGGLIVVFLTEYHCVVQLGSFFKKECNITNVITETRKGKYYVFNKEGS